jgi:HPt (histidine-containing phosphotransfer) domain-containing protein
MIRHIHRDLGHGIATPADAPMMAEANAQPAPAEAPAAPQTPPTDLADQMAASSQPAIPVHSIDDVDAIPFDFSTKAASDELGLPEALVQEFVSDFAKQAEENIAIFREAHQKGDIDTIQKTAHLLKGAASNLRIDPLADTLKALQYNEEIQKVPELFAKFVGQLKSLVHFIRLAEK